MKKQNPDQQQGRIYFENTNNCIIQYNPSGKHGTYIRWYFSTSCAPLKQTKFSANENVKLATAVDLNKCLDHKKITDFTLHVRTYI